MLLVESNRGASVLLRPIRRTPIEPLTVSSSSPRVAAEEAEAAAVAEAAVEPAAAVLALAAVPAVAAAVPAVAVAVPAVALAVQAVADPAPVVRAQAEEPVRVVAVERVRVPGGDPAAVPDPALVARQRDRAPESAAVVQAKGQSRVTGQARRRVRLE
jgi:hypothetical protein